MRRRMAVRCHLPKTVVSSRRKETSLTIQSLPWPRGSRRGGQLLKSSSGISQTALVINHTRPHLPTPTLSLSLKPMVTHVSTCFRERKVACGHDAQAEKGGSTHGV
jgi:hypothetical protein